MKNHPNRMAEKPITTVRPAKRSSPSAPCARSPGCYSCAVSSVVRCRKISSRLMRSGRSSAVPTLPDDGRCQLAPHVASRFAVDLKACDGAAGSTPPPASRPGRPAARSRRRRPRRPPARTSSPIREARRQVLRRVHGDDPPLVDDDDAMAGLADFRKDVRAEDDGVIAAQVLDELACLVDLLRVEPRRGSSRISTSGLCMIACARPTRCRYPSTTSRNDDSPCPRPGCAPSRR